MKLLEPTYGPDWQGARVEAYLDGDLSPEEAAAFEAHWATDPSLDDELWLAGKVRDGLREMPTPTVPPEIAQAVLAQARHEVRADRWARFHTRLELAFASLWRPALAMATLVMVVVTAALVGQPATLQRPAMSAEVEQAMEEVKWTLALLSEVGRETGLAVRAEVLEPHVMAPMQEALGTARPAAQAERAR